jgi:antitoxin (DNA-binding transcriptional repressor) of toxin-antitoxin stability system
MRKSRTDHDFLLTRQSITPSHASASCSAPLTETNQIDQTDSKPNHAHRQHSRGKTHLSRLVEQTTHGEPFIIANAGKGMVRVTALDAPDAGQERRVGFLEGQMVVPDDFDTMGAELIEQMFGGDR